MNKINTNRYDFIEGLPSKTANISNKKISQSHAATLFLKKEA